MEKTRPLFRFAFDQKDEHAYKEELKEYLDDDARLDYVDDTHADETYNAAALAIAGAIESNVFCSPDWLAEIRERIKDPENSPATLDRIAAVAPEIGFPELPELAPTSESNYDRYSHWEVLRNLDEAWKKLEGEGGGDAYRELVNDIPNFRCLTAVDTLLTEVLDYGRYPTPEVLLAIAKAFQMYLLAGGELTLEDVFFGPPVKRAGNFAKRSRREQRYLFFHDTVRREQAMHRSEHNIEDLADLFLRYEQEYAGKGYTDPETFLRGYRAWKAKHPELADE